MSVSGEKVFPANLDVLKDIRKYVLTAARSALTKSKLYKLQLAVDETASNIILHGYKENNDKTDKIFIHAEIKQHSLVITLKDSGVAFDPRTKLKSEQKSITKSAEERSIGGLGIYLALTGVDDFSYEYLDGCNISQFEVFFDATS